jgi:hypothetical protein
LMTYYVLTFMRVASRKVCIARITTLPDRRWMEQMARNVTLAEIGFLCDCRYLLHDRDAKFCAAFDGIMEAVGIKAVTLPPRSPNLNAHLERWNRSVKEECLSKMILFGEASLRQVLSHYVSHFHSERNHQPNSIMNAVLTFSTNGTGSCLYTELIDLHSIGRLEVSRATAIEFNNQTQHWEVKDRRGTSLFFARSRQACLSWEHNNLP